MTTTAITPLRQRMIEDMNARKLCAGTQRGHVRSCKRFAAFLKRSPDTATLEDIRRFQLHLADTGVSLCNRNRIFFRWISPARWCAAAVEDCLRDSYRTWIFARLARQLRAAPRLPPARQQSPWHRPRVRQRRA